MIRYPASPGSGSPHAPREGVVHQRRSRARFLALITAGWYDVFATASIEGYRRPAVSRVTGSSSAVGHEASLSHPVANALSASPATARAGGSPPSHSTTCGRSWKVAVRPAAGERLPARGPPLGWPRSLTAACRARQRPVRGGDQPVVRSGPGVGLVGAGPEVRDVLGDDGAALRLGEVEHVGV